MGKRSAAGELFLGNMGSIQRETRPSMQREDQLTMETKLERIAAKCCESPVEERSAGCAADAHGRGFAMTTDRGDKLRER
jgi:hypothetical protein